MPRLDDKRIKTGKGMGADGEDFITAKELVEEFDSEVKKQWSVLHPQARVNESMYHGRHGLGLDGYHGSREDIYDLTEADLQNTVVNYLPRILDARVAIILEQDPVPLAFPNSAYGYDPLLGEFCTALLLWNHAETDMSNRVHSMVTNCQLGGKAGLQPVWENEAGPLNPLTGERGGAVDLRPLTVFSYADDGAELRSERSWCAFRATMTPHAAVGLLRENGVDDVDTGDLETEPVDEDFDDCAERVEVWEYWSRPGARFPRGLRLVCVGGHVAAATEFPYAHGRLPCATYSQRPVRSRSYGTTWMSDAVKVQLSYNMARAAKHRRVLAMKRVFILASSSIFDQLDTEGGGDDLRLLRASKDDRFEIVVIDDPKIEVFTQLERESLEGLERISGVPQESGFSRSQASTSAAKAIAFRAALLRMPFAGEIKAIESLLKEVGIQSLALMQEFAPDWLLAQIVGEHHAHLVDDFRAMDLDGLDIKISIGSATDETQQGQAAQAGGLALQGVDPERNFELARTGLRETVSEMAARDILHGQVNAALDGQDVRPDQRVPARLGATITEQLAAATVTEPNNELVVQLSRAYLQLARQQEQPPTPQQPDGSQAQPDLEALPGQNTTLAGIPL